MDHGQDWDITKMECITPLEMNDNGYYVKIIENRAYEWTQKKDTITILDLTTQRSHTLPFSTEQNRSYCHFEVIGDHLVAYLRDQKTISIWCVKTGKCLHEIATYFPFHFNIGDGPNVRAVGIHKGFFILHCSSNDSPSFFLIFDLATGQIVQTLATPLKNSLAHVRSVMSGDRLIIDSIQQTLVLNFGSDLELELETLRKMASFPYLDKVVEWNSFYAQHPRTDNDPLPAKDFDDLFRTLRPCIQGRLRADPTFKYSPLPAIVRLRAEVCVEILLRAIQDENGEKVRRMLSELKGINPKYTAELYRLLWMECEKSRMPKPEIHGADKRFLSLDDIREVNCTVLAHRINANQMRDESPSDTDEWKAIYDSLYSEGVDPFDVSLPEEAAVRSLEEETAGSLWGECAFQNEEVYDAPLECKIAAVRKLWMWIANNPL